MCRRRSIPKRKRLRSDAGRAARSEALRRTGPACRARAHVRARGGTHGSGRCVVGARFRNGSGSDRRLVGPRGVKLSGGQVQRVALARMFVREAELMVLDDVSSALDSETEAALWEIG